MHKSYAQILCTNLMLKSGVRFMHKSYAQILCTNLMHKSYAQIWCKIYAQILKSKTSKKLILLFSQSKDRGFFFLLFALDSYVISLFHRKWSIRNSHFFMLYLRSS